MIDILNRISEVIVSGITKAFSWLPPIGVLLVHALLMGILALAAYALVSNQAVIKRTKNRLLARVLEIRLFQDDPLAVGQSHERRTLPNFTVHLDRKCVHRAAAVDRARACHRPIYSSRPGRGKSRCGGVAG